MEYHKHKRVLSNGKLKSHLVTAQHKDKKAQIEHNLVIGKVFNKLIKPLKAITKQENIDNNVSIQFVKKKDNDISFEIDDDGYIFIDLDKTNVKGLKLLFTREENSETSRYGKKRTVGLQFENLPAKSGKLHQGKFAVRKKY